ncbi:hypothetical protein [Pedobacter africanus]|uniref:Uncharacterized protein n=1 Tax=Pedobacter africanus TaxID=151894 RepID=A0A1W2EGH6_9SPHI|nr:hypothetical protein [Pedobacter africanus]SMD08218.1 hypothetical protein SAMN04488524_4733 [Pedobacter africanus]
MRTLSLKMPAKSRIEQYLLMVIGLLLWFTAPKLMQFADETTGVIDQSIWLLVLLAALSFMLMTGLCWWLLQRFWLYMGLPELNVLIMDFKQMELWQQLSFWLASFALLLLAGIGALVAVL